MTRVVCLTRACLTPEVVLNNASNEARNNRYCVVVMVNECGDITTWATDLKREEWALVSQEVQSLAVAAFHGKLIGGDDAS